MAFTCYRQMFASQKPRIDDNLSAEEIAAEGRDLAAIMEGYSRKVLAWRTWNTQARRLRQGPERGDPSV